MKLKITSKVNDRGFKEGDVVELNLIPGLPNYIVGPNGCGKSTIIHAIRAYKDSIYEHMPQNHKEDIARNHDLSLFTTSFYVEGLEQYEHVFSLDAVIDNPVSFMNAATATALVNNGGLFYGHKSHGECAKMMVSKFISDIRKITGAWIDKETKKIIDRPEKRSLIILDELDEGLDLNAQASFSRLLTNVGNIFNADVICVCHNPFCILSNVTGEVTPVYDMSTRSVKLIKQYIKEQTGLTIKVINDEAQPTQDPAGETQA